MKTLMSCTRIVQEGVITIKGVWQGAKPRDGKGRQGTDNSAELSDLTGNNIAVLVSMLLGSVRIPEGQRSRSWRVCYAGRTANGWDGRPRSGPFSVRSKGRQGKKASIPQLHFVMAAPRNVVPAVGSGAKKAGR